MGMFDDVVCERTMPDGFDGRGVNFQTKDFDCALAKYEVTAAGRLVLLHVGVYEAEQPPEDLNFHGILNFYGGNVGSDFTNWREYNAKFTDGTLVEIVRVPREDEA